MNIMWHIFKFPPSPFNAIDVYTFVFDLYLTTIETAPSPFYANLSSLWQRFQLSSTKELQDRIHLSRRICQLCDGRPDPNTNRAGEELDEWGWMTIDQWPTGWVKRWDEEKGWNWWLILMSFLLMSDISIFDQPHKWEGDEEKRESNATDSRLQQLHAVMSNEVWLAHHKAIFLSFLKI